MARRRHRYTSKQLAKLEAIYQRSKFIGLDERRILAIQLNLSETQVIVWFNNRRQKDKKFTKPEMSNDNEQDNLIPYRNYLFERFCKPIPRVVIIGGPNNRAMPTFYPPNCTFFGSQSISIMPSITQRTEYKNECFKVENHYTSKQVVNENEFFRPWESNRSGECMQKNVENVEKYLQQQNDQHESFRKPNISRESSVSPQPMAISISYPIQKQNMNSTHSYKLNIDSNAFKRHGNGTILN